MPAKRIRTVLIDDSAFMRKLISDLLAKDETIELVGMARNGQEGVEMSIGLKADVVVTDIVMPEFDGLYVLDELLNKNPVPVIMLSSLDKSDNRIFEALERGAFSFLDKPTNYSIEGNGNYALSNLIKEAAKSVNRRVVNHDVRKINSHDHVFEEKLPYDIILIGASTGGPGAVETVLTHLPRNLTIPVIVVQHMPQRFLETFTERLNLIISIPVILAKNATEIRSGVIYITSGDQNMYLYRNKLSGEMEFGFTDKKFEEYNYPSIDSVFESAALEYGNRCIGIILTGMGKDGARGLLKIKKLGGITIAQDEKSSVVYGMPKAAVDINAANYILSLRQIPGFIISGL